jgi:hypothetical protein
MEIFSNNKQSQNQDLLKQQMDTQQKINDLLEKSSQVIACGPECQKNKISDELKQKYLDAQTNIQTAPINLEKTKRNYYTYTKGKSYYDSIQENELTKNAEKIASELTTKFNDELEIAHTMNSYLQTALINSGHSSELLSQYKNQNYLLEQQLSETHGDILTNDRKTYYETDALKNLKLWYRFYWYIYYFLFIVLIIGFILSKSILNTASKIIIAILLMFYPYYIDKILHKINNFYHSTLDVIPKNVYNNL